jgi:ABC-type transport system involved in cytochrome bd biosynthesis fused ATPase/permease subunit
MVIGKKGQGTSSFINMLIGSMKKIEGSVFMCGKIAYLPEKFTHFSGTVKDNISLFSNDISTGKVR